MDQPMSKSRAKGTAAETALVAYLNTHGFPFAERRALHGTKDTGDIAGVPGWVIEVKNCAQASVGAWLAEATDEAVNAGVDLACVWHKRAGKGSPGDWWVTMHASVFAELVGCTPQVADRIDPLGIKPVTMTGAAFVALLGDAEEDAA